MQAFLEFNLLPIWFKILIVLISGLSVGSFLTLLSYRLVSGESIIIARSKCVNCHTILKAINLIPIFSWTLSKGKCSKCGSKISWRYPLIEFVSGALFFLILFINDYQISWIMVLQCLVAANLLLMIITDLENYFIPNQSQISLFILLITLLILDNNLNIWSNIFGGFALLSFSLLLLGFFYVTTHRQAIGIDDIKFFFIAGFYLTIDKFLFFTLLTGIFGVIFGLIWRIVKKEDTFPFAPAMCLSLFLIVILGKDIDLFDVIASLLVIFL